MLLGMLMQLAVPLSVQEVPLKCCVCVCVCVCAHIVYAARYAEAVGRAGFGARGGASVGRDAAGGREYVHYARRPPVALLVQKYLLTGTKVLAYWYKSTCFSSARARALVVQKYKL